MGKSLVVHSKGTAAASSPLAMCPEYRSSERQSAAQHPAAKVSETKVRWRGEKTRWRKDEKNAREDLEKPKAKQHEDGFDENTREDSLH